ncbi:MAG: type II toxin-antitoxin system YafQ family toxin [Bacteroidales bacterium]|nr:type II toxin-antitoxin system YafQ family toxin [Bacteroidales bacterium]
MKKHYELEYSSKFLKDLKLAKRRGLDLRQLKVVTDLLQNGIILPVQYRDHLLTGNYKGYRECHINPDWLLIYKKKDAIQIISLLRTGTHSDLFQK